MDLWVLGGGLSVALALAVVLLSMGKPFGGPLAALAWASAVFTADTGLGGAGAQRGVLTLPKLAPLALLLVTSGVFLLARKRCPGRAITTPLWWMSGYVAWLAIAAVLGGDPVNGLLRVVQFSIPLVAVIARRRRSDSTVPLLLATVAAAAAHVAYAVVFDPHYVGRTGEQRLTGLLIANAFGLAAGVTLIGAFGLWLVVRQRAAAALLLAVMGAAVYGLVQSAARTAAIAVLVALPAVLWLAVRGRAGAIWRKAALLTSLLVAAVMYVVVNPGVVGQAAAAFTRGNDDLAHLTGRVPLWGNLLVAVAHRPLLGYGPSAYRAGSVELGAYLTAPQLSLAGAHNSLLEAAVEGGVPASMLWLGMMVALGAHVWRTHGPMRPMVFGLYVFSCVSTITGTNANGIGMGWFLIVALAGLAGEPAPLVVPAETSAGGVPLHQESPGRSVASVRRPAAT